MVATGSQSPFRSVLVFWFLLVCPGMAFVKLLPVRSQLIELTLAVAGSIVLNTLVAEVLIYTRRWSPEWGLYALVLLSFVGVALQIWRGRADAVRPPTASFVGG
jgi:uncharacterized membrane protein